MTGATLGDRAKERFERVCPGILGNPFIPKFPHIKQQWFLSAHRLTQRASRAPFECLFGGAAGGGKSFALLMAAAQYAWQFGHFRALLLRRTRTEAKLSGNLIDRAKSLWLPRGVRWDSEVNGFVFPSGAVVNMGYHSSAADDTLYQGGEWHLIGFDELTHWPLESTYEWLRSRCRKAEDDPVPLRVLNTSNPGGPGHTWVKNRFVGGIDPTTGRLVQARHLYIPSRIDDNPGTDREAYKETLRDMHPTRRAQLLDGDWNARDPGDYFRVEWFGPMLDPDEVPLPFSESLWVRWWDLAASENPDAARTAGVLMGRCRAGARFVKHATAFRATPGKRDDMIVQQALVDSRNVTVGIEIEGGSGGIAQFDALASRLRAVGFRVVGARPRSGNHLTDKETETMARNFISDDAKCRRADPVASCLERGFQRRGECPDTGGSWWGVDAGRAPIEQRDGLRLFIGAWTQAYLDELEGFPAATPKDLVDATSGAWAWLEAHPFGQRVPPAAKKRALPAEVHNVHPEDRPEEADTGKNKAGHWRL